MQRPHAKCSKQTAGKSIGSGEEEWLVGELGRASEQLCYYRWVLLKEHVFIRQKGKNGIKGSRGNDIYGSPRNVLGAN